jgi:hypothetical protein
MEPINNIRFAVSTFQSDYISFTPVTVLGRKDEGADISCDSGKC